MISANYVKHLLHYPVVITLLFSFVSSNALSLDDIDSNKILTKVDSYRVPFDEGQIYARLIEFKNDKISSQSKLLVSFNKNNDSLIQFLNTSKKGQKVLLTNKKILLFLPRSRRIIRLTPLQRIMGQASYGDIVRSNWADNYYIKSIKNTSISEQKLELVANKNLEYDRINVWVKRKDKIPIKADLFLKSGKLFKSIKFEFAQEVNGNKNINKITFFENRKINDKTILFFDKFIQKKINDSVFRER